MCFKFEFLTSGEKQNRKPLLLLVLLRYLRLCFHHHHRHRHLCRHRHHLRMMCRWYRLSVRKVLLQAKNK